MGVPPQDIVEDVARALRQAGLNPDTVFARCSDVSNEWDYSAVAKRFTTRYDPKRQIPMVHKTLEEVHNLAGSKGCSYATAASQRPNSEPHMA